MDEFVEACIYGRVCGGLDPDLYNIMVSKRDVAKVAWPWVCDVQWKLIFASEVSLTKASPGS